MSFYLSFLNKFTMKIVTNSVKCVMVATDRVFFLFFFVCANVQVIQFCIRFV